MRVTENKAKKAEADVIRMWEAVTVNQAAKQVYCKTQINPSMHFLPGTG